MNLLVIMNFLCIVQILSIQAQKLLFGLLSIEVFSLTRAEILSIESFIIARKISTTTNFINHAVALKVHTRTDQLKGAFRFELLVGTQDCRKLCKV